MIFNRYNDLYRNRTALNSTRSNKHFHRTTHINRNIITNDLPKRFLREVLEGLWKWLKENNPFNSPIQPMLNNRDFANNKTNEKIEQTKSWKTWQKPQIDSTETKPEESKSDPKESKSEESKGLGKFFKNLNPLKFLKNLNPVKFVKNLNPLKFLKRLNPFKKKITDDNETNDE